jgi:predicted phage terminase large subunit-like protein
VLAPTRASGRGGAEAPVRRIGPQPGPQSRFLASSADIAVIGGAAGGGKTFGLLLEPLRHVHNPLFGAVVFRRTSPQIRNEGGLWDKAVELYPHLGARPSETRLEWTFPSGAGVTFAHLQHETDKLAWHGSEVALLEWDELTHFSEGQFFYLLSRNRSLSGVRPYVRAACNADADSWVARFVDWWIGEDGYALPERSGVLRWMVRVDDEIVWADDPEELRARFPEAPPKSVTFVLSTFWDNPILMRRDPGYLANLMALPRLERERLLGDRERGGNWKIRPTAGKVFSRGWFGVVDAVPAGGRAVRAWDLAATAKKLSGDDPDSTAGVKMRAVEGVYYVEDVIEVQEGPAAVKRLVLTTAAQDGRECAVRLEQEPGASGLIVAHEMVTALSGYDARARAPSGDKIQRALPFAAQAEAGNVKLLRAPWNERYATQLHNQPDWPHDDQMDASSAAFNDLARGGGWASV